MEITTNLVRNAGEWHCQRAREICVLTKCSQINIDPVEESPPVAEAVDPQLEQLAWAVGKLIQQQETLAAIDTAETTQ